MIEDEVEKDYPPKQTLYIRNINQKIKSKDVKYALFNLFQSFGQVVQIICKRNDKMRGQAFVVFRQVAQATSAKNNLNGYPIFGKPMVDIDLTLENTLRGQTQQNHDLWIKMSDFTVFINHKHINSAINFHLSSFCHYNWHIIISLSLAGIKCFHIYIQINFKKFVSQLISQVSKYVCVFFNFCFLFNAVILSCILNMLSKSYDLILRLSQSHVKDIQIIKQFLTKQQEMIKYLNSLLYFLKIQENTKNQINKYLKTILLQPIKEQQKKPLILIIHDFYNRQSIYNKQISGQMIKLEELLQTLQRNKNKSIKSTRRRVSYPQIVHDQMKVQIEKNRRCPWKGSTINGREDQFIGLRGKALNSWQISRIVLSDRTYAKNQKDVKIQAKNTYFSKLYNHRDSNHQVYVYQNQLPKIDRIKSLIRQKTFLPSPRLPSEYFGQVNNNHISFSQMRNYPHPQTLQ